MYKILNRPQFKHDICDMWFPIALSIMNHCYLDITDKKQGPLPKHPKAIALSKERKAWLKINKGRVWQKSLSTL